jgi:hypothetical protein
MVMKPFKTYFDAYTSLAAHLKQAADEVFREHKNQPNYTAKLNLAIHRAYQRWATESGISSEDMRDLAIALSKFSSDYVLGISKPERYCTAGGTQCCRMGRFLILVLKQKR